MTNPGGRLWVNPEGVVSVGDTYAEHVALYDRYLKQVALLRERYGNSWGDDEMGTEFSAKFLAGLDNLEGLLKGVKATLEYVSEGLRSSGVLYRTVDDEATEVSRTMAIDFDEHLSSPLVRFHNPEGQRLVDAPVADPGRDKPDVPKLALLRTDGPPDPPPPNAERRPLRKLLPIGQDGTTLAGDPPLVRAHIAPEGVPLGDPFKLTPSRPAEPPLVIPPISAMVMSTDYHTAHVDGVPLAEGYRLQGFVTLPDGTVRLDLNRYEVVLPAGQLTVTTPDGHPITPGDDHQLFVVKDDPNVDPTAPGYRPLYVAFAPDGTPTPLVTDLP